MKRDISACEALIKKQQENEEHLKTIIENQKNTMADLKRKLESGPAFHTLEYLEDSFSKKISCLKDSIKETITSEYQKIIKCNTDQNSMSYADATKSKTNEDLICNSVKLAVKKANKEEKIEEIDKKRRIRNIVVHGVQEKVANKEVDTKTWTDKFTTALHTCIKIKKISRIGSAEGRIRPILIELESEKDKFKLLNNLTLLKGSKEYTKHKT